MRFLYVLFAVLLAACSNPSEEEQEHADKAMAVEKHIPLPENFYKRYSGELDGKAVVVHLNVYKGRIQGFYHSGGEGAEVLLRNRRDSIRVGNTLYLKEQPVEHTQQGDSAALLWTITITDQKAHCMVHAQDGSTQSTAELTEDYSNGAVGLYAYWIADSVALIPQQASSPKAICSYGYLLPTEAQGDFLYGTLKRQVFPAGSVNDNMKQSISAAMASYFAAYRHDNEPLIKHTDESMYALAFSFVKEAALFVRHNEGGWLVTELSSTELSGGMHSNISSSYNNIDLREQHLWNLQEIINDTMAIRPMLNDAAIAYFQLRPGEGLGRHLLVDDVPVTSNLYVGARGLSFVYNPYEIASYADGQISLYLPYSRLLSYLTPAFKKRMALGERRGVAMRTTATKSSRSLYASSSTLPGRAPVSHRHL